VFLCGEKRLPWLLLENGKDHDFFYQFPNRSEPVRKAGYQWNADDQPVQDVMDSKFNEVALDYNAGLTASLAWLTGHGLSAGDALPDTKFPPPVEKDESADLLATDREFFVAARRLKQHKDGVEIEATLFNRSRWPARVCKGLSFRYEFTPDAAWTLADVRAQVRSTQGDAACKVKRPSEGPWYVEVEFPGEALYPGDRNKQTDRRTVVLSIEAPGWDRETDRSLADIDSRLRLLPAITVYDDGKPLRAASRPR
jgi:hypothetical protein